MGCDIHLFVEVKVNEKWHCYNHPNVYRCYDLFAKMAGVRGEETPIATPRGLPSDVTEIVAFASQDYGVDGHSHSYLTSTEIQELEAWAEAWCEKYCPGQTFWFNKQFGFLFGNSFSGYFKYPNEYPNLINDFRFVFWFDN
jgi:hypothetical protein